MKCTAPHNFDNSYIFDYFVNSERSDNFVNFFNFVT